MFIYPENLKAKATLWLWELKSLAVIGTGLLASVLCLAMLGTLVPFVATTVYAFLSIRTGVACLLDFLRYAAAFFITKPQKYEWGRE